MENKTQPEVYKNASDDVKEMFMVFEKKYNISGLEFNKIINSISKRRISFIIVCS